MSVVLCLGPIHCEGCVTGSEVRALRARVAELETPSEGHGDCACERCQPALFAARKRIAELEKAGDDLEIWPGTPITAERHEAARRAWRALRRPGEGAGR